MDRTILTKMIAKLPNDVDLADVEELVVGKIHNLPGEALADMMQLAPPEEPVVIKKRKPRVAKVADGKPAKADAKILSIVKRRKNGISMKDIESQIDGMSANQIRTVLKRLPVKTTGNKRSTLYHAK